MRNAHLKTVRNLWKECVPIPFFSLEWNTHDLITSSKMLSITILFDYLFGLLHKLSSARMYFGRGALMAKALGSTPEDEHRPGISKLTPVRTFIFAPSIPCLTALLVPFGHHSK